MPEPIPVTDVLSELDTQWNSSNVTEPQIIEMNGPSAPTRVDLNRGDILIGQPGSPTFNEVPIGNWNYVNRTYGVILEITTKTSRQRLYDLIAEIRRICHARRHNMTNFQRLQFLDFTESVDEQINMWTGVVQIQVVNTNVLAET